MIILNRWKDLSFENKLYLSVSFFTILYFNLDCLYFILRENPFGLSAIGAFSLDSPYYERGSLWMIKNNKWLLTKDIYHSPGAQIWISWIFRLFNTKSLLLIKLINLLFFIITQFLLYKTSRKLFNLKHSLIITLLFASSHKFKIYTATLQYEILLTLIISIVILIFLEEKKLKNYHIISLILSSIMLFLFRYHYIYIGIFALVFLYQKVNFKKFLASTCVFFTLALTIGNTFIKSQLKHSFSDSSKKQLRWLSPSSKGFNYPYPKKLEGYEPGYHYIYEMPVDYLKQLGNRFQYLFSLKKDDYYTESRISLFIKNSYIKYNLDILINFSFLFLILIGFFKLIKINKKFFVTYIIISPIFYAPQLIIGSTSRFIMPLFPLHIIIAFVSIRFFLELFDNCQIEH